MKRYTEKDLKEAYKAGSKHSKFSVDNGIYLDTEFEDWLFEKEYPATRNGFESLVKKTNDR